MKKFTMAVVIGSFLGSSGVGAQVPAEEWEQFKAEFAAMSQRVIALERENRQLREAVRSDIRVEDLSMEVAALQQEGASTSWAERVKWQGDFRYRYEEIEESGMSDRERNRIRARAALVALPTETTEIGLGMASGGDNPVSTNQTLGGGGSTKDLRLDLAYATWSGLEGIDFTAGKFVNPYYRPQKSGLVWDNDFRPEGVAVKWRGEVLFATATYNFLESDSSENDEAFWGAQIGGEFSLLDAMTLTATANYLEFPTRGRPAIDPDDPDFFGNSSEVVGGREVYAYDYSLASASLNLDFSAFEMPVTTFADYVHNNDAGALDTGYIIGLLLGKAKAASSWQLRYQYQDLEADATLGVLNDSNFAGGETDGKGHMLAARYQIDKSWYLGATYFDNKRGVDLGGDTDYRRLIFDTGFKY